MQSSPNQTVAAPPLAWQVDSATQAAPAVTACTSTGHMPHLDGIRAFAVCAVILEHWASGMPRPIQATVERLDLGAWGVECFFVLSGFLITLLLLQAKAAGQPFPIALRNFYTRRALRIFPAYYLVLLIGVFVSPTMREVIGWHALYVGNLYPLWHDTFLPLGGHFWSLAVEEQFYLFWPPVVLLLPRRTIMGVALMLCVLGPLSRAALWLAMGGVHLSMWTIPTTTLDLLGFGALLACVRQQRRLTADHMFMKRLRWVGLAALLAFAFAFSHARGTVVFAIVARSLTALVFGSLVLQASFGFRGVGRHVLGNRLVVWLGIISYGLYVFHPFVPPVYLQIVNWLGTAPDLWGAYYVRYPLLAAMLLLVTSLSFRLIEQPIRSYGRHFT